MGIFGSMRIAATGLTAQRLRQDVISNNIANATTTRTPEGGPYRRSRVILAPKVDDPYWKSPFLPKKLDNGAGQGVRAVSVEKDYDAKLPLVYDPTHPDAIKSGPRSGYVEMPNVNIVQEMTDLISASRAYQANIAIIDTAKSSFSDALQIGR